GGRAVGEGRVGGQEDQENDQGRARKRRPGPCPDDLRRAAPLRTRPGRGDLGCGGHPEGGDATISRTMRRPSKPALLGVLTACACLAAPAGASASSPLNEYQ